MGKEMLTRFEKKNSKGEKYYFFKNMSEILDLVENNRSSSGNSEDTWDYSFTKTKNMEEAIDLAKFGWEEGTKTLNKKIKVINTKTTYKNTYDMIGSHVSVPRFLNGHPQSMIRRVEVQRKDNVINLIRFASVVGSVSAEEMIENGVKFVELIQNLESQGYRCNVDVIFASDRTQGYGSHFVRLRIKNSNERLNIMKMSFPMCHPAMFRRFVFKLREIEYGESNHFRSWNMDGRDEYAVKKCEEKLKPYLNKNDYLIPMMIDDPENFELKKIA